MTNHRAYDLALVIMGCAAILTLSQRRAHGEFGDAVVPDHPYSRTLFPGKKEGLWPPGTNWPGYKDEVAGKAPRTAQGAILFWPKASRALAKTLLEKYGKPSRISRESLAWDNKGAFLKTVVFRDADWIDENRQTKGDILQQTVSHRAIPESVDAVAAFDTRIVVDCENATMTSTSSSEKMNILALNLADEIARGEKTPGQALVLREKVLELEASGKSSPLAQGLMFQLQP